MGDMFKEIRRKKEKLDIAAVTDGVPCRGDPKLTPDWHLIH